VAPLLEVEFRRADPEEEALRQVLWGVDSTVIEAAEKAVERTVSAGRQPAPGSAVYRVELADLDFRCRRVAETVTFEKNQALSSYSLEANPARLQARSELEAALEEWLELQRTLEETPPSHRALARDRLQLAHGRLLQARFKLKAQPRRTPLLEWKQVSYPVRTARQVAELSVRLAGEDRWITARWETVARESAAGSDGPSPGDREALFLRLAGRLGELLRQKIEQTVREEARAYYVKAMGHLERGSSDLAVENLVYFLLACPEGGDGPPVKEVVRQLERLSGCRAAREWAETIRPGV
jgi:hypothetical protein